MSVAPYNVVNAAQLTRKRFAELDDAHKACVSSIQGLLLRHKHAGVYRISVIKGVCSSGIVVHDVGSPTGEIVVALDCVSNSPATPTELTLAQSIAGDFSGSFMEAALQEATARLKAAVDRSNRKEAPPHEAPFKPAVAADDEQPQAAAGAAASSPEKTAPVETSKKPAADDGSASADLAASATMSSPAPAAAAATTSSDDAGAATAAGSSEVRVVASLLDIRGIQVKRDRLKLVESFAQSRPEAAERCVSALYGACCRFKLNGVYVLAFVNSLTIEKAARVALVQPDGMISALSIEAVSMADVEDAEYNPACPAHAPYVGLDDVQAKKQQLDSLFREIDFFPFPPSAAAAAPSAPTTAVRSTSADPSRRVSRSPPVSRHPAAAGAPAAASAAGGASASPVRRATITPTPSRFTHHSRTAATKTIVVDRSKFIPNVHHPETPTELFGKRVGSAGTSFAPHKTVQPPRTARPKSSSTPGGKPAVTSEEAVDLAVFSTFHAPPKTRDPKVIMSSWAKAADRTSIFEPPASEVKLVIEKGPTLPASRVRTLIDRLATPRVRAD